MDKFKVPINLTNYCFITNFEKEKKEKFKLAITKSKRNDLVISDGYISPHNGPEDAEFIKKKYKGLYCLKNSIDLSEFWQIYYQL